MLFLLMKPGHQFTRELVNAIKDIKEAIRKDLSKRHVPKYIFETPEIPVSFVPSRDREKRH
jgi:acetoacetyl-CoA synthetase